ncbi:RNA 2',3'-cyclic phosphodiesterase [Marinobacterium nitratireducens]|uniref:RNA 2',3'-cyclic phosphodiesterase n=1 Tax=Marinobacterium nitratireducens TaxID=518897 RepID=A0A918DUX2_9GAMM|nr:RNA 2',3'-cyclic phosphodiesterase [Marinobacterium nitratireducens]GGO82994.1 RNA 2',3'-cyclic phosphodiesterase [Marinobacterium nitratireducens]
MNIRAFFALKLGDQTVRRLADQADSLCAYDRHMEVDWVDSESYHLTLSFLGDITLSQVERLERESRARLEGIEPLQIQLNAFDYLSVSRQLAVVAAISDGSNELMEMHRLMVRVAAAAGVLHEETDFRPHVTLGRLEADNRFSAPESWPSLDLTFPASSVVLYQSKPGSHGSLYTPLFEVPLQYGLQRARYA